MLKLCLFLTLRNNIISSLHNIIIIQIARKIKLDSKIKKKKIIKSIYSKRLRPTNLHAIPIRARYVIFKSDNNF